MNRATDRVIEHINTTIVIRCECLLICLWFAAVFKRAGVICGDLQYNVRECFAWATFSSDQQTRHKRSVAASARTAGPASAQNTVVLGHCCAIASVCSSCWMSCSCWPICSCWLDGMDSKCCLASCSFTSSAWWRSYNTCDAVRHASKQKQCQCQGETALTPPHQE